jgi:hypothetical protein
MTTNKSWEIDDPILGRNAMLHKVLAAYSLFAGLTFCAEVCAAEGKLDYQSCFAGTTHVIQADDGIVSMSYDLIAMTPEKEGQPLSNVSGRCIGSVTIIKNDLNEIGSCELANAAGDKYMLTYARKGDPVKSEGTWKFVHGTGKFAGITGDGKWTISDLPPVSGGGAAGCGHEWGTYSVK